MISFLLAAAVVSVGDGTVQGSRLAPYENAWIVTQTFKDGTKHVPGIWTDRLSLREIDGRKVFVRTQGMLYANMHATASTNVMDPVTLAPISHILRNPDDTVERHEFKAPAAGYDFNCCMRSLIPAALPLRLGYSVALPAILTDPTDDAIIEYRVLAREKVQAGLRGTVDAWLVETVAKGGCDCVIHFWIDERPPFVLRMTLSPGKGHEYDQSFDMIR